MDNANEQAGSSLPLSKLARIDQISDRFEHAIRDAMQGASPWPCIEEYLGEASEPLRAELQKELQRIETNLRHPQAGTRPPQRGDVPETGKRTDITGGAPTGHPRAAKGREGSRIDADSNSADRASTKGWLAAATEDDAPDAQPDRIGDRYRVESCLGEGAFGSVYRCYDEVLKRTVALKVPHRKLLDNPELYLAEARVLAGLEHPAIVRVYDFGQATDGLCYVVSAFVEGSDLKKKVQAAPLLHREAAELAATVADALHYAHVHGVVHRDIKPANILIDSQLRPYLADFGLALKDEDFGEHGHGAGTPAYMSPEQARSEGHLVDGRSDIFSLGVVLYELLTAKRPFRGSSIDEILERIRVQEPRPPRQIDDGIPKELERICLKAIAKRASDRYNTARDMADDLRAFLADFSSASKPRNLSSHAGIDARPVQSAETHPASASGTESEDIIKIVPKGLRSFDHSDADFFLKLLPGPHDRYGLPESIRFWKSRIEDTEGESGFRAGIIYGPSGCGKSSLVKAGLLPRLDRSIVRIYVEATAGGTEERLLRAVRRRLPDLNEQGNLVKVLAAVRRGQGLVPGDKLLLVIDQFEQWLHAGLPGAPACGSGSRVGGDEAAELVLALRQCDGARVQCLLMVRDDFWLAVSRFMQALEVRVVEGENSRLADLFDERHARKVLAALGVAFGALPESVRTKEQDLFLDQAVAGLAQEGKVVPVRLALFAEMVKGKPWTPSALREIGGAEGVGVAFLEETFSSRNAPPQHKLHQKAAQAVLAALLPESGSDIRGHMRSRDELLKALEASGCRTSPGQFDELLALLDQELRLVTPADIESPDDDRGGAAAAPDVGNKYYQLTHDYLVPSLRDWLASKQKATRRGRAQRRLADFTSLWTAKPENRRLPTLPEYVQIRLYTSPRMWQEAQRRMMRAAARLHAIRALVALAVAIPIASLAAWSVGDYFDRPNRAHRALYNVEIDKLPSVIGEIDAGNYRRWLAPRLRQDYDDAKKSGDDVRRLRASLALLPGDDSQVDYLCDRLVDANVAEIGVIRNALLPYKGQIAKRLWGVVKSPASDQQCLCAASSLALYAPDDPRWNEAAGGVAAALARSSPFVVKYWIDALRGVQDRLVAPLSGIACDTGRGANERLCATNIVAACAPGRADLLAAILIDGNEEQFALVFPCLSPLGAETARLLEAEIDRAPSNDTAEGQIDLAAQRKARAAVALLRLGQTEKVWPLLRKASDETVRSYLLHWSRPLGADPQIIFQRCAAETDAGARCALLLLLGEFPDSAWRSGQRQAFAEQLLTAFGEDPDPQLHAAAQWLLNKWKCGESVNAAVKRLAKNEPQRRAAGEYEKRRWYVNAEDQTYVVVDAGQPFRMGSPPSEHGTDVSIEQQHLRRIGRQFAIAANPVTIGQFRRSLPAVPRPAAKARNYASEDTDVPQTGVTWFEAAKYCNWLSAADAIPEDQWCYKSNEIGNFAEGMIVKEDYLKLAGYRLPTEAEWEFACRAGTTTRYYFGSDEALLPGYARYRANSQRRAWPVAGLKPNDFGLFDMHGNVWQWCQWPPAEYPVSSDTVQDDRGMSGMVRYNAPAALRGGGYDNQPDHVRAAFRYRLSPNYREVQVGFRPARTIVLPKNRTAPSRPRYAADPRQRVVHLLGAQHADRDGIDQAAAENELQRRVLLLGFDQLARAEDLHAHHGLAILAGGLQGAGDFFHRAVARVLLAALVVHAGEDHVDPGMLGRDL